MERIVPITGNVTYSITLDPSVWILDERKQKLTDFFTGDNKTKNSIEEYTKEVSAHWDREIKEGAKLPSEQKAEKKFTKEKLLNETFAISMQPFLHNCEPSEAAKELIIHSKDGTYSYPIEDAYHLVLCFSENGKALKEDGPLHVYDINNKNLIIKNVVSFEVL
ncbi:MAG: peptidyl-prolyl cis-trans isomerase [Bacillus sp. (in: firmicutes)]